jgi:transcriptional regulator with XRE-family HTH domain
MVNHDETFTAPIPASALGERLATARQARGWSQRQLAVRSGVSSSTVSRLELGSRRSASISVAKQLADGLGCPVEDLIGFEPATATPPATGVIDPLLLDLQRAIVSTGVDRHSSEPERWTQTDADIARVSELRRACDYRQAARLASLCLTSAHAAIHGPHRAEALPALAHLYFDIAFVTRTLGDASTAWVAADRSLRLSSQAGDRVGAGAAAFAIAHVALTLRAPERALDTTAEALAGTPPDSPDGVAITGMLHLTAAMASSRLTPADDSGVEKHIMSAIERLDAAAGHHDRFNLHFGPTNVRQWQMAIALDAGDHAGAAAALAQIDPAAITSLSRLCAYNIDLARLYAVTGRGDYAVRMLLRAHTLAPQYCAHSPAASATIRALSGLRLGRTETNQLRMLTPRRR